MYDSLVCKNTYCKTFYIFKNFYFNILKKNFIDSFLIKKNQHTQKMCVVKKFKKNLYQ